MKMSLVLHCLVAVLLLPTRRGTEAVPVDCCLRTSSYRIKLHELQSYTLQDTPLCPLRAVRFVTKGPTICSDPLSPWARKAVAFLDKSVHPQRSKKQ
ncbi:monocyte chemotactic protein 1B [Trichomycterus rosablanca]|uniref:monocyte chemotactic protein 1B n=1 Tax=Trichomycterus rosablanca TaxID=2290929 RepID=UPI002F350E2E